MTPAIERLIHMAEVARTRIQSLAPVADALVYELGEAIREVEADTVTDAAPDMLDALQSLEQALRKDARDKTISRDTVEYHIEGNAMYHAINKARAGIAKARRRENGE